MTEANATTNRLLHDLRNPLAAIYTAVSIMAELPSDTPLADVRRHVELIEQAVCQGRDLIDDAQHALDSQAVSNP